MSNITDRKKFEKTILAALEIGGFASLVKSERERGYKPVFPGQVIWLPKSDWPNDVVVSMDGNTVRIVAIKALKEGSGSFRRLIESIIQYGLSPVIIEPMLSMPDILTRWGWSRRMVGNDFETREEQWFPSALLRRVA